MLEIEWLGVDDQGAVGHFLSTKTGSVPPPFSLPAALACTYLIDRANNRALTFLRSRFGEDAFHRLHTFFPVNDRATGPKGIYRGTPQSRATKRTPERIHVDFAEIPNEVRRFFVRIPGRFSDDVIIDLADSFHEDECGHYRLEPWYPRDCHWLACDTIGQLALFRSRDISPVPRNTVLVDGMDRGIAGMHSLHERAALETVIRQHAITTYSSGGEKQPADFRNTERPSRMTLARDIFSPETVSRIVHLPTVFTHEEVIWISRFFDRAMLNVSKRYSLGPSDGNLWMAKDRHGKIGFFHAGVTGPRVRPPAPTSDRRIQEAHASAEFLTRGREVPKSVILPLSSWQSTFDGAPRLKKLLVFSYDERAEKYRSLDLMLGELNRDEFLDSNALEGFESSISSLNVDFMSGEIELDSSTMDLEIPFEGPFDSPAYWISS